MADYGIKIARAGKDVSSSTPGDYHFWSKYRARSIKYQGTLSATTNSGTDPVAITAAYTHSFGYIPQFMVFTTSYDGNYINLDYTTGGTYGKEGELWNENLKAYASSSAITVSADLTHFYPQSGTGTGIVRTYTFDIILFMEEVETS